MLTEVEAVRRFSQLRVLVVGDAMLDSYYIGSASRLSPEGPVPVVQSRGREHLPGGAANTAANARALGAKTSLLAVVGADHEGELLRARLADYGVDVSQMIVDPSRPTTTKLRILADGHFMARYDIESDADLSGDTARRFIATFRELFRQSDVVIVSDYMKGVVTPAFVAELSAVNRDQKRLVVVDSKDLSRHRFRNVSIITPNHLEAQKACLLPGELPRGTPSLPELESLGRHLLEQIGTRWVIITAGADGALLFERDGPSVQVRARKVRSPDAVGAGDTFTAALALAVAAGAEIQTAARIAVEASGIAVGKRMTAAVDQQELVRRLSLSGGVLPQGSLLDRLEEYRAQGRRLVFTNGAFDGLNSGHIAFLREARRLGDVLIVGVNSDESLRKRNSHAPFHSEDERLSAVASLDTVDHAVLFDEETPCALIREIRPNVHAKGGDYREDDLPEAEYVKAAGGQVVILPLVEKQSSQLLKGKMARQVVGKKRSQVETLGGNGKPERTELSGVLGSNNGS
ncbi:MAG: PfkB family carbohydrate kinase [Chloroflexota bacterium]